MIGRKKGTRNGMKIMIKNARGVGEKKRQNDRNGKTGKVEERSKEGRIQNMKEEQQEKEESKIMVKEK